MFLIVAALEIVPAWQFVTRIEKQIFLICGENTWCHVEAWKVVTKKTVCENNTPAVKTVLILKALPVPPCPKPPERKARLNRRPPDTLPYELADMERMVVTACLSMTESDKIDGFLSCERRLWKKAINDACRTSPRWCKDYRAAVERRRRGGQF